MLYYFNKLKANAVFLHYLNNTSWMLLEQLLRILSGFFIGVWTAKILGPNQYGLLSYVLAYTSIFGGIAKLGLDTIVVREIVQHQEKSEVYLGTAFWLKIIGGFIATVLIAIISILNPDDSTTNLYIFIITIGIFFQSFEVIDFYFQSKTLAKIVSSCRIIQLFLASTIRAFLILYEADLIYFVLAIVFDSLVLAGTYYVVFRYLKLTSFYTVFDKGIAIQLLNDSLPLMLGGLAFIAFSNADVIIIKEIIGSDAVGIYTAAYKLASMWYFLPGLILNSLLPALITAQNNHIVYARQKQILTGSLVWFAIILATITSFFSDSIINYTFGEQYKQSSTLLSLLMWVNVIIYFNSCWNKFHIINKQSKYVFLFHVATAIFNISLNLYLIPKFDVIGAAYGTILSLSLSILLFSVVDKTTLPLLFNALSFGLLVREKKH